ncbi:heterokaryon incompatibility protein-domain-containing protein [Lasiosphaeris hirsuta]|uniref:Heterokaryon incompatibility protein-domain-containing protein n=1 Tax=Lasiosphaeris hirsuta TaxID=260670 RepID=A0AA40DLG5_9PEZI|nr:heterokaryon incompatibility protein-domain-containing protein [Lasiosphaeris hirsuta]
MVCAWPHPLVSQSGVWRLQIILILVCPRFNSRLVIDEIWRAGAPGSVPIASSVLYQALQGQNDIRLMQLEPGSITNPVRVNLTTVDFRSSPPYDAISYVWGNQTPTHTISCNGVDLGVTANLHSALVQARLANAGRLVWADAVCINQSNVQERGSQVASMGLLYRRAVKVLICMGNPPDENGAEMSCTSLPEWPPCTTSALDTRASHCTLTIRCRTTCDGGRWWC